MSFSGRELMTADSDSKVIKLDVGKILQGQYENPSVSDVHVIDSSELDKHIPAHKQTKTWVLDVLDNNNTKYFVDSKGQITLIKSGAQYGQIVKKIHGDAITSVLASKNCIFTASRDRTVKVWDKSMVQIGQFFCPSPVTSMCLLASSGQPDEVPILCGDQLGNVHLLTWLPC